MNIIINIAASLITTMIAVLIWTAIVGWLTTKSESVNA